MSEKQTPSHADASKANAAFPASGAFVLVLSTGSGDTWGRIPFSAFEALAIASALSAKASSIAAFEEIATGRRVSKDELLEITQQALHDPTMSNEGQVIDLTNMPWCF